MAVKGIPASSGLAIGRALWLRDDAAAVPHYQTPNREAEWQRYEKARTHAIQELREIRDHSGTSVPIEELKILDAHELLLDDPEIAAQIREAVVNGMENVEQVVIQVYESYAGILEGMEDEYLAARAGDVREVKRRLLDHLLGNQSVDWTRIDEPIVVLADDMGPAQTSQMPKNWVKGLILRGGSRLSHASIVARSLGIPAVVGCGDGIDQIPEGTLVGVNGHTGEVKVDFNEGELEQFEQLMQCEAQHEDGLRRWLNHTVKTRDGTRVEVYANIGSPAEAERAALTGADGIGLFRTEFLLLERKSFPSEDEQYEAYRDVLMKMVGKPVVVRTFDIGGDKPLSYFPIHEENPFLGYRGIRIGIHQPELLQTQLRALYRASRYGNLRVMFPMVSTLEEWLQAKQIADEAREEVGANSVPLGIMVETPAAVLTSDVFAKYVDFFSIGTNDLTQYVMAADRGNSRVAELANPFHPAVLRALYTVIQTAVKHGKLVGMCGEFAGETNASALLLAMGLREFSMSPGRIVHVKERLNALSIPSCENLLQRVLECESSSAIRALL